MDEETNEDLTVKDVVGIAVVTLAVTYCAVKIVCKADDFLVARSLRKFETKRNKK